MALADLIKKAAEGDADAIAELEALEDRKQYLEGELDKAIKARDKVKAAGRMSETERQELETLRAAQAEAEEARARKDGEYDKLKATLEQKVAAAEAKAAEADQRFAQQVKETAFRSAPDLFGPTGRTVLTPTMAATVFASHAKYIPGDQPDQGSLVVHDLKGEPILTDDGNPAPFAEAMGRLIDSYPDKDAILRGSGRAGSGATAGTETIDYTSATRRDLALRAAAGDQEAIAALRAQPVAGQVQSGPGFARLRRQTAPPPGK